jgi:GTP-sensing pleiotropic transcriptional regulator CodY
VYVGNEKLYGYKINKHKNHDKVKNILFKKRIYGKPNTTIELLA